MTTPKLPVASSTTTVNIDAAAAALLLAQLESVPAAAQAAMEEAVAAGVEAGTAAAVAAQNAALLAQSAAESAASTASGAAETATNAAGTATSAKDTAVSAKGDAEAAAVVADSAKDIAVAAAASAQKLHTLNLENLGHLSGKGTLEIDGSSAYCLRFPLDIASRVFSVKVLLELVTTADKTFQFLGEFAGKIFLGEDGTPYCDLSDGTPVSTAALAGVGTPLAALGVTAAVTLNVDKSNGVGRLYICAAGSGLRESYDLRGHLSLDFHPATTFTP